MRSIFVPPLTRKKLAGYFCLVLAGILGVCGLMYFAGRTDKIEASSDWSQVTAPVSVEFGCDYSEAIDRGAAEGKPILLFFSEPGSPFSGRVRENTFTDTRVVELSRGFICVEIDTGKSETSSLMKEYGITGSPTVQFVSSQGIPLLRVEHFDTISEFKEQMEGILHPVAWQHASLFLR